MTSVKMLLLRWSGSTPERTACVTKKMVNWPHLSRSVFERTCFKCLERIFFSRASLQTEIGVKLDDGQLQERTEMRRTAYWLGRWD